MQSVRPRSRAVFSSGAAARHPQISVAPAGEWTYKKTTPSLITDYYTNVKLPRRLIKNVSTTQSVQISVTDVNTTEVCSPAKTECSSYAKSYSSRPAADTSKSHPYTCTHTTSANLPNQFTRKMHFATETIHKYAKHITQIDSNKRASPTKVDSRSVFLNMTK